MRMTGEMTRHVWLVARWEFLHTVRRIGFLAALVSLPLVHVGLAAIVGLSAGAVMTGENGSAAIALVDPAGIVVGRSTAPLGRGVRIEPSVESARTLLLTRRIAAFAVIDADYLETGRVAIFMREGGGFLRFGARIEHRARVAGAIRDAILSDRLPSTLRRRVLQPEERVDYFAVTAGGQSRAEPDNAIVAAFAGPLGLTLLLGIGIFMAGGTLQQSMSSERENRMLEVLLTSVRAEALVAGKVLGLSAAGFLQLAFYVLVVFATAGAGLSMIDLSPGFVIAVAVCFLTGYALFAVLMGVTGAIARSSQESMQAASVWMVAAASPLMLVHWVTSDGGVATARVLSWFPLTAPVTVLLRVGSQTIGVIEMAGALTATWLFTVATLVAGGRLFRRSLGV